MTVQRHESERLKPKVGKTKPLHSEGRKSRVDVLDAEQFENEIESIIYRKLISVIHPAFVEADSLLQYSNAIRYLVKASLICAAMYRFNSSIGEKLMRIHYNLPSRMLKGTLATVIASSFLQCIDYFAHQNSQSVVSNKAIKLFSFLWQLLSLRRYFLFLNGSSYQSLPNEILKLRPVCDDNRRYIDYVTTHREFLWSSLVQSYDVFAFIRNYLTRQWTGSGISIRGETATNKSENGATCVYCGLSAINAVKATTCRSCVACFFCSANHDVIVECHCLQSKSN